MTEREKIKQKSLLQEVRKKQWGQNQSCPHRIQKVIAYANQATSHNQHIPRQHTIV